MMVEIKNKPKIIDVLTYGLLIVMTIIIIFMVYTLNIMKAKNDNLINSNQILTNNIKQLKSDNSNLTNKVKELKSINDNKSLIFITRSDLEKFMMNNYKKTSSKIKKKILDQIFIESKKYNINPILLFAVPSQESTMRPWIRHSFRRVNVPLDKHWNKYVKKDVQAIGLCGIIWEIWKFHLIENKIAEVKSDLYDPVTSIKAMAWIINYYSKQKLIPGTYNKDESAIQRYFGVNGTTKYLNDINQFIGELTRNKIYRK